MRRFGIATLASLLSFLAPHDLARGQDHPHISYERPRNANFLQPVYQITPAQAVTFHIIEL